MTLEFLQKEMITALKAGDKTRKGVISDLVGAVKKAAIDKGCRDNCTEDFVDSVLLKEQKTMKEMIDTCPVSRPEILAEYKAKMAIINEFAPTLLTDPTEIHNRIVALLTTSGVEASKKNKGQIMKIIMPSLKGKADMSIVNKVISEVLT